MSFFVNHFFGSFEETDLIYKNKNRFEFLEDHFQLPPDTSESIVQFTASLYNSLIGNSSDDFTWAFTTHLNFE